MTNHGPGQLRAFCGPFQQLVVSEKAKEIQRRRILTMTIQCCKCKRIREGGGWMEVAEGASTPEQVSHGYCPVCAAAAFKEIRAWEAGVRQGARDKAVVSL
jgi:hypothetical protein